VSSLGEAYSNRPATLADYLAILRRRKWIIIGVPVMAALVAYAVSTTQAPLYTAKTEVLFHVSSIPAEIANLNTDSLTDPKYLPTQASIASSPELAQRVVAAAGVPGVSAGQFLGQSSAGARADVNILDLAASYSNADDAVLLANAYAEQFTKYKAELDTKPIRDQLDTYAARIKQLSDRGQTSTLAYQTLVQNKLNLETFGAELAHNSSVLQRADGAAKVRPLPRRNAIIGGLLGGFLALGLAFLAEALDKRVRSEQEIEDALGLPLLGRVPGPGRRLRKANELVMLVTPTGAHSETFRKLRTSLEFVNVERGAKTIMVTSAVQREGKSTTVANLAVALARAGRRVALVDLDLRRPFLHTFFHIRSENGFTDVVVNRIELDDAIRPLPLPAALDAPQTRNGRPTLSSGGTKFNGRSDAEAMLHFVPSGTIPPAADELLESERVSTLLAELSKDFDVVLVDAPPLLAVGDVLTLSTKVDAILVITRLGIHRPRLHDLARQLQNCRAPILGFVLTGVSHGDSYSYGYGYDPHVYDAEARSPQHRGQPV
jgi:succinoglycan biosynthesis transport protein ExoP